MKFAAIGHQDNWQKITQFVNKLRSEENNAPISTERIKEVYPFFPPTKLFDVTVKSPVVGSVEGMYIETFISPDELDKVHLWKNIGKVKKACEKAASLGADVVSLGGFTSIVLEAGSDNVTRIKNTAFTTGNTLTAAFIASSVEKACRIWHCPLQESRLLIIGSTGDIGSACVSYFEGQVKEILLVARQAKPLYEQEAKVRSKGFDCRSSVTASAFLSEADIVICVASSLVPDDYNHLFATNAIICDAGYPKNLKNTNLRNDLNIFEGGMGVVNCGFSFFPDYYQPLIYGFPFPNVSHGCLIESMVLAMEEKAVAYSQGRGNITKKAMREMLSMAAKHEIEIAPFFQTNYSTKHNPYGK